jgi:translation initiation factor IF-1
VAAGRRPISVQGTVVAILPRALYRVRVDGRQIVAHAPERVERNFVRLVVGDSVTVELESRDQGRGRIVRRR